MLNKHFSLFICNICLAIDIFWHWSLRLHLWSCCKSRGNYVLNDTWPDLHLQIIQEEFTFDCGDTKDRFSIPISFWPYFRIQYCTRYATPKFIFTPSSEVKTVCFVVNCKKRFRLRITKHWNRRDYMYCCLLWNTHFFEVACRKSF